MIKVDGIWRIRNGVELSIEMNFFAFSNSTLRAEHKKLFGLSHKRDRLYRTTVCVFCKLQNELGGNKSNFDIIEEEESRYCLLGIDPIGGIEFQTSADSTGSDDLCAIDIDDKDRFSSLMCRIHASLS